jgi:hypothetical protein
MSGADRRLVSSLTWPLARRFDYFGADEPVPSR